MAITLLNPDGLPKVDLYHQVSVASGSKLVFIAGQVARTADGGRVGDGDLAAQTEQCYLHLHTAPDKMAAYVDGAARAFDTLGIAAPVPPLTGIGVAALAEPDLLIEIEATAVLE
jgi:enamine deaminase RidA (YjgF/YER057c/UK114 family)